MAYTKNGTTKAAKRASKPASKPAPTKMVPAKAGSSKKRAKAAPTPAPSAPAVPVVKVGVYYRKRDCRIAIVYGRDSDGKVLCIAKFKGSDHAVERLDPVQFLSDMAPAHYPQDSEIPYPIQRAASICVQSEIPKTDKAMRVLLNLRDNRPVKEVHLEEILNVRAAPTSATTSTAAPRIRRQGRSTDERRKARKAARMARLSKMTPKEIADMRKAKKERRAELRKLREKS